jgi:hypothetical protein
MSAREVGARRWMPSSTSGDIIVRQTAATKMPLGASEIRRDYRLTTNPGRRVMLRRNK